jgi:hypothetical protein
MKTFTTNQLRDTTGTEMAAPKGSPVTDASVTDVGAGIAEILNMRVGCWRAPIDLWTEPTAA